VSEKLEWMPLRGFPVKIDARILDARQAKINHGQTLERLAERGGLGMCEAAAIAEKRQWRKMSIDESLDALKRVYDRFRARGGL
jgi:hypothetical protein